MSTTNSAIAHVVTWRLNGQTAADRERQAQQVVRAFEVRRHEVPGLRRMEVGVNIVEAPDAWDVALYMEFASRADLDAYQTHPSHLEIKQLVGPMRAARGQADFELLAGGQSQTDRTFDSPETTRVAQEWCSQETT